MSVSITKPEVTAAAHPGTFGQDEMDLGSASFCIKGSIRLCSSPRYQLRFILYSDEQELCHEEDEWLRCTLSEL